MNSGTARLMRKEGPFAEDRTSTHQCHTNPSVFIFVMNAKGAAFNEVQGAIVCPLLYQNLAAIERKRIHVRGQYVPVWRAEPTAQPINRNALGNCLRQALDIKTDMTDCG